MRGITFILSIVVLALSCLPCADSVYDLKAKEYAEILAHSTPQDDHDHKDACSPFCHCTCCASFFANNTLVLSKSVSFAAGKNFTSYLSENIIEISLPIWQPPQLSA